MPAPGSLSGTPLSFTWYTETAASAPFVALIDEAITSEAKQAAGINVQLFQKTFNYIASSQRPRPFGSKYDQYLGRGGLRGLQRQRLPDTERDLQHRGLAYNSGGYHDPKMDRLIKASVFGSNPNAVTQEAAYEASATRPVGAQLGSDLLRCPNRVGGPPGVMS